ncbi:MAG: transposase [Methanobacteriaceae archaeon]|jgi:transposase|nr:transposase [Methanobacteriaceae archaeon]
MNRVFDSIKIKNKQIVIVQENRLKYFLDEYDDLKEELSNERRIVMILDNYSAHISKLARRIAKFLNIKFIFLPIYSPKLNPIEQVWRSMKKRISSIDFKSLIELSNKLKFYFKKYVTHKSFTKEWMNKFIFKS